MSRRKPGLTKKKVYRLIITFGFPTHLLLQHITVMILLPTLPLELTSLVFVVAVLSDMSFLLSSWKYNLVKVPSILQFRDNWLVVDHDKVVPGQTIMNGHEGRSFEC